MISFQFVGMFWRPIVFSLSLTLAAMPAIALQWEFTELDLKADFDDEQVVAKFPFVNDTDRVVTLTRVSASCGCTVPTLSKRTYEPGESGSIEVVFTFGARQGINRNAVTVQTDDPQVPMHSLSLVVDIPVAVQIRPRVVNWRVGTAATPKVIEVVVHPEAGFSPPALLGESEFFKTAIHPMTEPGHYQVIITPLNTLERQRATFSLTFDSPQAKPMQLFAMIM